MTEDCDIKKGQMETFLLQQHQVFGSLYVVDWLQIQDKGSITSFNRRLKENTATGCVDGYGL